MDCLVIRAADARSVSREPPGWIPRSTWQCGGLISGKPAAGRAWCSSSTRAEFSCMTRGAIGGPGGLVRKADKLPL